jgi:pimeloyl-ACP methyl ester carboxylesterase
VVYFGGNAEDVSVSLPGLVAAFPDRAIYAMHYRGFGGSTGSPSETALVADGLALVDEVRRTHPQVTVIGRSLGSGVAVQVAAQRRLERLVLVTPYDSIVAVAGVHFAWFPVDWIVRDRFESVLRAPALTVPTTVIAADGDTVIPRVHTQRLLAAFRAGVARYVEVPDSNHDSISDRPQYVDALREAVR